MAPPGPQLWQPLGPVEAASPGLLWQQTVELSTQELFNQSRFQLPLSGNPEILQVDLQPAWGGGWIWKGEIAQDPHGQVLLAIVQDTVAGTIRWQERTYQLQPLGPGKCRLQEVDFDRLPQCGQDQHHAVTLPQSRSGSSSSSRSSSSHAVVDSLVCYTPQAAAAGGGASGMEATAILSVAETNQGYEASQVNQRIELVHVAEMVGYTEHNDYGTNLSRLRNNGDGYMDEAHTLRDQYGADVVTLLVANSAYCGVAYLMTNVGHSFESWAFNVVTYWCSAGIFAYGHELGHNFGCHHDRQNASQGAYAYSYGYRTPGNEYRTVMAYSPGNQVNLYSNPNITHQGFAMGIADPDPDSAENWKTLNNTASTTSQWRASVAPILDVGALIAGQAADLCIRNAQPNAAILLGYSTTGPGPTNTIYGAVELSPPILSLPMTADSVGYAELGQTIPLSMKWVTLWLQAVDLSSTGLSDGTIAFIQ